MEDTKKLKLFIHFLKKERIYSQYLDALINDKRGYRSIVGCKISPTDFIVDCIKNNKQNELINCAFEWSSAEYLNIDWFDIACKWDDVLHLNKLR